jgi:hypothetical protein
MRRLDAVIEGGFESAGFVLPQYENGYINFFSTGEGRWRGTVARSDRPGQSLFVLLPTATCAADFDGNGVREVPDIFAFLAAWFGMNPSADVDGTPGIGVPDIFFFLSLWFTGCP